MGPGTRPLAIGETATFQLQQFEVLNLQAAPLTELFSEVIHDLTGTTVEASQRVAVFGGHEEAVIAFERTDRGAGVESPCCADHLEEQLLPLNIWSAEALCVKANVARPPYLKHVLLNVDMYLPFRPLATRSL